MDLLLMSPFPLPPLSSTGQPLRRDAPKTLQGSHHHQMRLQPSRSKQSRELFVACRKLSRKISRTSIRTLDSRRPKNTDSSATVVPNSSEGLTEIGINQR